MKRPTDKDYRLFTRLSDIHGDLIQYGEIPSEAASAPVSERRGRWDRSARAEALSIALVAAVLALTVSALLIPGVLNSLHTQPSVDTPLAESDTPSDPSHGIPTHAHAAQLRKGMGKAELLAIMGNDCAIDGNRYTFTLDTGELLTVDMIVDGDDPSGARIGGFLWSDETGSWINPLELPEDILQNLQEYALDRVLPLYRMDSLFGHYQESRCPSAESVMKGAELGFLRICADGTTVLSNKEGHGMGGAPENGFGQWVDVSPLFHESVRIKKYYPILTDDGGTYVYIVTAIGDYILYPLESENSEDTATYLVPAADFHLFAFWVGDLGGTADNIPEECLRAIEPFDIASEAYQQPVNMANPKDAERMEKIIDLEHSELFKYLGPCHHCARESTVVRLLNGDIPYTKRQLSSGFHYWELTDGRCFVSCSYQAEVTPPHSSLTLSRTIVSDMIIVDSVETVNAFGAPSLALASLIYEEMNLQFALAILGEPTNRDDVNSEATWLWVENREAHSLTIKWTSKKLIAPYATVRYVSSIEHTTQPVDDALGEIEIGMTFRNIDGRLGPCLCGHTADTTDLVSCGYHFWGLPDGSCLAVYMGFDIRASTDPFGTLHEYHYPTTAMQILRLDSPQEADALGTPSLSRASLIENDMKEEVVLALLGQPTATADSLASVWTWDEDGKTHTVTVYWKENQPEGLFENFNTVALCEQAEGTPAFPLFPDKVPSPSDAATITEWMTSVELLQIMGSRLSRSTTLGDTTLYCWKLTDGRVFCALTEGTTAIPSMAVRRVTYTFFRDSLEDVSAPTFKNSQELSEGNSLPYAIAVMGTRTCKTSGNTVTWVLADGDWWEISIEWELIEHPETGNSRTYITSITYR